MWCFILKRSSRSNTCCRRLALRSKRDRSISQAICQTAPWAPREPAPPLEEAGEAGEGRGSKAVKIYWNVLEKNFLPLNAGHFFFNVIVVTQTGDEDLIVILMKKEEIWVIFSCTICFIVSKYINFCDVNLYFLIYIFAVNTCPVLLLSLSKFVYIHFKWKLCSFTCEWREASRWMFALCKENVDQVLSSCLLNWTKMLNCLTVESHTEKSSGGHR